MPTWIDTDLDDSIRVLDSDRLVVFDRQLHHVRTVIGPTARLVWHAAFLRPNTYIAQSRYVDANDPLRTMPLIVRNDSGRTLASIDIPKLQGRKVFLAVGRHLSNPRELWLVEWISQKMQGYRISILSEEGKRQQTWVQSRDWWMVGDDDPQVMRPLSNVRDVKQIDERKVGVLIATPKPGWASVTVNPRNLEGDDARYEARVDVLSVSTGSLVGTARLPGYPICLLSHGRVAVYRETAEGEPVIVIARFEVRR